MEGNPTGFTANVFTGQGWPSNNDPSTTNTMAIRLQTEDGETPELDEIYFRVSGAVGTNVKVIIETPNNTRIVEEVGYNHWLTSFKYIIQSC